MLPEIEFPHFATEMPKLCACRNMTDKYSAPKKNFAYASLDHGNIRTAICVRKKLRKLAFENQLQT